MAPTVVDVNQCGGAAMRTKGRVPQLMGSVKVMREFVSCRDECAKTTPLHRASGSWRDLTAGRVLSKAATAPMLLVANQAASAFDDLELKWLRQS